MSVRDFLRYAYAGWRMSRYIRPAGAVPVHLLVRPVEATVKPEEPDEYPGDWALIGEAVELGLRAVLEAREPDRVIETVEVPLRGDAERWARRLADAGYTVALGTRSARVTVTGATDLEIPERAAETAGLPRLWEVKTTRARTWRGYMQRWVWQTALYSALYGEPVLLLIVKLSEGDGAFSAARVAAPRETLRSCVAEWLSGAPPGFWSCWRDVGVEWLEEI